jgi:hypothetical protein
LSVALTFTFFNLYWLIGDLISVLMRILSWRLFLFLLWWLLPMLLIGAVNDQWGFFCDYPSCRSQLQQAWIFSKFWFSGHSDMSRMLTTVALCKLILGSIRFDLYDSLLELLGRRDVTPPSWWDVWQSSVLHWWCCILIPGQPQWCPLQNCWQANA